MADPPDLAAAGDHAQQIADRDGLTEALGQLPPRQRAVVLLRYCEDRSEAEVPDPGRRPHRPARQAERRHDPVGPAARPRQPQRLGTRRGGLHPGGPGPVHPGHHQRLRALRGGAPTAPPRCPRGAAGRQRLGNDAEAVEKFM
ncbi:sigma factor-like helix-turn-helix DNA-binding protein [Saccharothrix deserti]|uniref:sigma factor-like helix-turn-helix DNA-binding protein n=1 Tax=Saccharothrix deserti TaxID=2593674 RepID=UPI00131BB07E